jgi:exopolyphosphatase / guanosine-5'-triphosphate,3'-diphosphate pyrophosphatase
MATDGIMNAATFEKTMITVDEISRACDSDPSHNEQVTTIALALFDALRPLHKYGDSERRLLEISSRLHDIGWSQTVIKKHHKLSGEMILNLDIPGLVGQEKVACALVARYHTKAIPDASKHPKFAALSFKRRNLVEWLAGILRVADALDSSHTGVIRRLKMQIDDRELTVQLQTNGDCWDEIRRARRKEDLLVKKSGRQMVYQC